MSRPNQRLDASEDAAAYRVASLLRQQPPSRTCNDDMNSLRCMTSQIEQFLSTAPQVPAVRMEPEWMRVGEDDDDHAHHNEEESHAQQPFSHRQHPTQWEEEDGEPVVQLSVVAGVLEEQNASASPYACGSTMSSVNGVLLPTAANQQELHRQKVEQAQAMLNLMSALSPHADDRTSRQAGQQASPNLSTRVMQHSSSSDDDEVAVMDADELNDEDSSEDDMPVQRRRIQEMN